MPALAPVIMPSKAEVLVETPVNVTNEVKVVGGKIRRDDLGRPDEIIPGN